MSSDFLTGATVTSVRRKQVCADHQGLPYHVAVVEGVAADGRNFISTVDERLVSVAADKLHETLRRALA
jgi:hypothetical protein